MNSAITTTDKFSWARVRLIWNFYFPAIKLPLILYPIVCVSVSVASLYLLESFVGVMVTGLISMIYGMAIYLFPVFFCRYKSPVMEAMLPVTAGEKMVYFIGVTLLIPILLGQVPSIFITDIIKHFREIKLGIPDTDIDISTYGEYSWYSLVQQLSPLFACLFVVITCRKNRIGLSIAAVIGTLVIMGILSGIIAFINVSGAIFSEVEVPTDVLTAEAEGFVNNLFWAVGIFSVLFCTTLMTIAYFRIKHTQI